MFSKNLQCYLSTQLFRTTLHFHTSVCRRFGSSSITKVIILKNPSCESSINRAELGCCATPTSHSLVYSLIMPRSQESSPDIPNSSQIQVRLIHSVLLECWCRSVFRSICWPWVVLLLRRNPLLQTQGIVLLF